MHQSPVGMFLSFVSAKKYYTFVIKKIIDHYKTNYFDLARDPFDTTMVLGPQTRQIKARDTDPFYAYHCVAHMNGYTLYSPSMVGINIALVWSVLAFPLFIPKDGTYYLGYVMTLYLLPLIFHIRGKKIPTGSFQDQFNRFVQFFWNCYEMIVLKIRKNAKKSKIKEYTTHLVSQGPFIAFLMELCIRHAASMASEYENDDDFLLWLYHDEIVGGNEAMIASYRANYDRRVGQATISDEEWKVWELMMPADMIVRYLFATDTMYDVVKIVLRDLYDRDFLVQTLDQAFFSQDSHGKTQAWEKVMDYIMSSRSTKKEFFHKIKTFAQRRTANTKAGYDPVKAKKINDFLDSVDEDNIDQISPDSIPDDLRKESQLVEKMMNFYITWIGGTQGANGDTWYLRLMNKPLIDHLMRHTPLLTNKPEVLSMYSKILFLYSKNTYFYQFAYDNVRSGKENFALPLKASVKKVFSNVWLIVNLHINAIATFLQDLNPHEMRIVIKNPKLRLNIDILLAERIRTMVSLETESLLTTTYGIFDMIVQSPFFGSTLQHFVKQKSLSALKNRLYTIDFWLFWDFLYHSKNHSDLFRIVGEIPSLMVFATLRETLLGMIMVLVYCMHTEPAFFTTQRREIFLTMYMRDILLVPDSFITVIAGVLMHVCDYYHAIILEMIYIDDNAYFMWLVVESMKNHYDRNGHHVPDYDYEEILWWRGYLKAVTYYNKRFCFPE